MDSGRLLLIYILSFNAICCFTTVIEEVVTTANINDDPFMVEGELYIIYLHVCVCVTCVCDVCVYVCV